MAFGGLLPKAPVFFDLFEAHTQKCVEGSELLVELLNDLSQAEEKARRVKDAEHAADEITHRTIETLHKTFITPIDRDEIHQLITALDDILDCTNAAAQRILLYEVHVVPAEAKELASILARAVKEVQAAVSRLRKLDDPAQLLKKCVEINQLENDADHVLRRGLAKLFKEQKDPIEIIKWKEILEFLERATDCCENSAHLIEGVVVEHG